MECACSHIMLGSEQTDSKNWNPNCEEHGLDSDWYNSTEQNWKRERQRIRTRKLQQLAREVRNGTISSEEAKRQIKQLEDT